MYCQRCASVEVKSTCVDFIEMREYQEIDLDQQFCIFPDCGHFLTVSSMDGQMDMPEHYIIVTNGLPTEIKPSSEPFSMTDAGIKTCPSCRGSLRNIARYGRIVRRAMLDEATKKFVTWSNAESAFLKASLVAAQEKLEEAPVVELAMKSQRQKRFGGRLPLLYYLGDLVGNRRYNDVINLWKKIDKYAKQVRKEEQPFHRVADFVCHANRQRGAGSRFLYDESIIQVGGSLVAAMLRLKCDLMVLSDFMRLRKGGRAIQDDVELDLSTHRKDCQALIDLARAAVRPKDQVQGHVFATQFCALRIAFDSGPRSHNMVFTADEGSGLREKGLHHVAEARKLLGNYRSTAPLKGEIDAAEGALNDGVYRPVSADELRAVYRAMESEFSGTGHWYACVNGHPFTIGECGMPMELARCPDCDARIGGQHHSNAEGVRRFDEIEQLTTNVTRMTV